MDIERSNVNQNSRNKDAKTKIPHLHNNSKSYRKIVEQNQNVYHNTHTHHRSLSGLGTDTSINSGGIIIVTPSWWNGAVMHVLTQVFQGGKQFLLHWQHRLCYSYLTSFNKSCRFRHFGVFLFQFEFQIVCSKGSLNKLTADLYLVY